MEEIRYYNPKTNEDRGEAPSRWELKDMQQKMIHSENKKSRDELNVFIAREYGGFCFLFYRLNTSDLDKQYIIRFLYLCTFMDYDNILVYGNAKSDRKYMTDAEFRTVLKLSKTMTAKTKQALLSNGLMYIDEYDHIVINKEYCLKGKVVNAHKNALHIRVFENAIRDLYEKATPREHRRLSLLVTLLPFINFNFNIICYTPEAEFEYQIRAMSIKDICRIVEYPETQSGRLKKELLALRVGGELVVAIVETGESETISINPRVYYRASDLTILEPIWKYFLIKNQSLDLNTQK
ncbi:hypothetical protein [Clostridium estertheticum]|uniref:hypothetical protein n=1 Tax=Clostridium estertheticum TaxID=238834 RepID=UPI001C0B072F|nr:hypothetical protein [Clostridium estertheticum]MBU3186580.1 hypothetical protein [Clostridium estertheticum]